MTTFMASTPARAGQNPAKHVNYTYGMVLGVDDFTQEFGYLSAKDRLLARSMAGYGTVSGLRVGYEPTYEGTDRGPRLSVTPGAALCPSGQFVCVSPAQCAYLVEWLAAHRADVVRTLGGNTGSLTLYVLLRYAECLTDQVPIPGEPCRSEDELTAPSRVRDDFKLDLSFTAPDQREEDAVALFTRWLRKVPVTGAATTTLAQFLAALRTASGVGAPPPAPPCPPLTGFFAAAPPAGISIPSASYADFVRAAWRVWVTEFLPCWRAAGAGCGCGCAGDKTVSDVDTNAVLLAKLTVAVIYDAVRDRLLVGPGGATVDETRRPYLVNSRLLQEFTVTGSGSGVTPALAAEPASAPEPKEPGIVACGQFDAEGVARSSFGTLAAAPRVDVPGVFDLTFDGYDPAAQYVVTGTAVVAPAAGTHVVEAVADGPGLAVRVLRAGGGKTEIEGFQLQVIRFGGDA
ncbi:hypothetical protein [Amycolatopsis sp. NPDC054798]